MTSLGKRLFFSCLLFVVTFYFFVSVGKWGFYYDDFGFLLHAKLESFADLGRIFSLQDIRYTYLSPDVAFEMPTATTALYRPMQYVIFGIQRLLFGLDPFLYYQATVALHAFNTVAIYNIFLAFMGCWGACWGALLFALHYSLARWFGIFYNQIYVLDLFFLILISLLLLQFLRSKRFIYYALSCLLFLVQLLVKETLVVMPLWVFCSVYFYESLEKETYLSFKSFIKALGISLGYGLMAGVYTLIRFWVLPMPDVAPSFFASFSFMHIAQLLNERLFMYVAYVCDLTGVALVPNNMRFVKGGLLALLAIFLLYPFWANKQKGVAVFLIISTLLFTWPSILLFHLCRYIYVVLPFICALFGYAMDFFKKKIIINVLACCCFGMFLFFNVTRLLSFQTAKGEGLQIVTAQFEALSKHQDVNKRTVCLVGFPMQWFFSGASQALELYTREPVDVHYDGNDFLMKNFALNDGIAEFQIKKAAVFVTLLGNEITIKILDDSYFFKGPNPIGYLGTYQVNAVNNHGFPTDVTIKIKEKVLAKNPLFVTWDYQQNELRMLNS